MYLKNENSNKFDFKLVVIFAEWSFQSGI